MTFDQSIYSEQALVAALNAIDVFDFSIITRDGRLAIEMDDGSPFDESLIASTLEVHELRVQQDAKRHEAWLHAEALLLSGSVPVTTSAGQHSYGIDAETRENLAGLAQIVMQIQLGNLPAEMMANPRAYTPKGMLEPVDLTHAEIVSVAAIVADAKDKVINAYLAHKSYIMAEARTLEELQAYDITANWPDY